MNVLIDMQLLTHWRIGGMLMTIAALFLFVACGGDDDDPGSGDGGQASGVDCQTLIDTPHRYTGLTVTQVMEGPTPVPTGVVQGPAPLRFTQESIMEVERLGKLAGQITNSDGGANTTQYDVVYIDGHSWVNHGQGWIDQGDSSRTNLVPYQAGDTCAAIAPDIDLETMSGPAEEINGIDTKRIEIPEITSDFASRHLDIGGGGDVGAYVKTFSGTAWVADDGYVAKLELRGHGEYPDGKPLLIEVNYEISDVGDDVEVEAPQ